VIARPCLIEKVPSGVQRTGCIILLSGPARFGKTALLSEFVSQTGQSLDWLSLDEGDSDYFANFCRKSGGFVRYP
jgi:LuxR family transcriptional regulator, maltose regulon positive regulatory protein